MTRSLLFQRSFEDKTGEDFDEEREGSAFSVFSNRQTIVLSGGTTTPKVKHSRYFRELSRTPKSLGLELV